MTNYVKTTDFAIKDTLASGNPLKTIKGAEFDVEFNNLVTASATKSNKLSPVFTGIPLAPTAGAAINSDQLATTSYVTNAISVLPLTTFLLKSGGALTGAVTTNSTFDGRNVGTDGDKLDGIETSATADQTAAEITLLGIAATSVTGLQAVAIGTNSAKVGITTGQATAIGENSAKVGITTEQATAIGTNSAKVGITTGQATAIGENSAKVGITTEQATAIGTNSAKVGITTAQATAIGTNSDKVGITTGQATAIGENSAKVGITTEQATAIGTNSAKVGITTAQATAIGTNSDKVGITTEQATAIGTNSAKVGITTTQATAIGTNSAKVGITTEQATAIGNNSSKVGITTEQATAITDALPKAGGIVSGTLDLNSNTLQAANLSQSHYTAIADASIGSGTVTLDYSAGDMVQVTLTATAALAFTNFTTGKVCSMILDAVNFGNFGVTYPAGTLFTAGVAPNLSANGTDRILIIKDKDDVFSFSVAIVNMK